MIWRRTVVHASCSQECNDIAIMAAASLLQPPDLRDALCRGPQKGIIIVPTNFEPREGTKLTEQLVIGNYVGGGKQVRCCPR